MFARVMGMVVAACALTLTGTAVAQAAPASGPLTGTQLAAKLLPASYFGAGYWLPPSTLADSGKRLERPMVKVNVSTYSCQKWVVGDMPNAGYGETAYAIDEAQKLLGPDGSRGTDSYIQSVYQFPSVAAATSYYQATYSITARCATVTTVIGGITYHLTTQSLTRGHFDGYPAVTAVQTLADTGHLPGINNQLVVLVGKDVIDVDAAKPPSAPRLSPDAATQTLIARVKAAS